MNYYDWYKRRLRIEYVAQVALYVAIAIAAYALAHDYSRRHANNVPKSQVLIFIQLAPGESVLVCPGGF